MTDEEAIGTLEERVITLKRHIKNYEESDCKTNVYQQLVKECQAIETVLNLMQTQQAEFERLEDLEDNTDILKMELEKKDKIIDLMAEQLTTPMHSKEWVIDYYKRKVEDK